MDQPHRRIRITLVEPEGKINFAFILRLAKNFGIEDICVVKPRFSIKDPEVLRFATRGIDLIEKGKVVVRETLNDCLENSKVVVCTTSKERGSRDVLRVAVSPVFLSLILPRTGTITLIFGRESTGLTREELKVCDIVSVIETGTSYNVLNLSHAVAIYLYELTARRCETGVFGNECSNETYKAMLREAWKISSALGKDEAYLVLKRILARASLRGKECGVLYKLFKSIAKLLVKD